MRNKICYSSDWKIDGFESPLAYVKQLLDSVDCGVHPGYSYPELVQRVDGIRCVIGAYKAEKSEKNKQVIASAVVSLLDDFTYAPDAIPVAAELGLSEAKEWFRKLIENDIASIRGIRTNEYSNALGCLTLYANTHREFAEFLRDLLIQNKLERHEVLSVLFRVGNQLPGEIDTNIDQYKEYIFNDTDETNILAKIKFSFKGSFSKFGDQHSIDIAKNIKPNLKKEQHLLYIKALEEYNGRFDKYLPEIKKILEI